MDVLLLATNLRYVLDCRECVNKNCRNERVLMKPWVQHPPVETQDWRVAEVYPAQVWALTYPYHVHKALFRNSTCNIC